LLIMAAVPVGDPAAAMERVRAVVAEGADMVEISGEEVVPLVAAVRGAYPELGVAVRTGRDEVAREACAAGADLLTGGSSPGDLLSAVAAECGVGLAGSLDQVERAVQAGVDPERVLVEGSRVADLVETGWPVLVSLSDSDADLARAAVFGWLGVRVFRVSVGRVLPVRRALSMTSAICGDAPPAHALRGLA
jgi:dihydropteroate synthase